MSPKILKKYVIYDISVLSNDIYTNNSISSTLIKKVKQFI